VAGRNAPSVINAVFNVRNFWDGRAQSTFNGVNGSGARDTSARVLMADARGNLSEVPVRLENSSLASQAVGPAVSSVEMSYAGREFPHIGRKIDRRVGKKLTGLVPLGQQLVHPEDSVLGTSSRAPQPGLVGSYGGTIRDAFQSKWWNSTSIVKVNADGSRTLMPMPNRALANDEFTMAEYNFSLFFGVSVQMYMATLVSGDTPLDRFLAGNTSALTAQQKNGLTSSRGRGAASTATAARS
jgi:cytochrome c peroxidase